MNHFMDGEWILRLWKDAIMVSNGHWRGTLARICKCRLIWRYPKNQRWDKKPLNGELRNTSPREEEKLQIKDRECIAPRQQNKCGGQKGSVVTCFEHAGSNPRDLRARTQDIVDMRLCKGMKVGTNFNMNEGGNCFHYCHACCSINLQEEQFSKRNWWHVLISSQQGNGTTSSMRVSNARRTQPLCSIANTDEMRKP